MIIEAGVTPNWHWYKVYINGVETRWVKRIDVPALLYEVQEFNNGHSEQVVVKARYIGINLSLMRVDILPDIGPTVRSLG
jgi:hypothetical protein